MTPFNPLIANYVLRLSNVFLIGRIVGKFANSRSVRTCIAGECMIDE